MFTPKGKRHYTALLTAVIMMCAAAACHYSSPSVTRQNFSTYYKTETKMLRPSYTLYNVTDSLSRLYFSIHSTDLLYAKDQGDNNYTAHILISYIVHPVEFSKIITDSGHVVMNDVAEPGESKLLASSVDMDVFAPGRYFLEVTLRDLNKMTISYALLYLDHRGGDSRNDFLFTRPGTDVPLFRNRIDANEKFNIHYYKKSCAKLFVRYYKNTSGPAPPPFAPDEYNSPPPADSSWWIGIADNPDLTFVKEGYYIFNTDSTRPDGICLTRFSEGFPEVADAKQLLAPLRYLTTKKEFMEMDTAANTKRAVDNFWLNASGSEERAREVIRNFYNRVGAANTLFSTEKEGWKTDRGMIYLIFGPPNNVYRGVSSETWIYSSDIGGSGLDFVFDHNDNAATDQEYVLVRNPTYKTNWYIAVDSWRQGHVYSLH